MDSSLLEKRRKKRVDRVDRRVKRVNLNWTLYICTFIERTYLTLDLPLKPLPRQVEKNHHRRISKCHSAQWWSMIDLLCVEELCYFRIYADFAISTLLLSWLIDFHSIILDWHFNGARHTVSQISRAFELAFVCLLRHSHFAPRSNNITVDLKSVSS